MTYRVEYTAQALEDLQAIYEHIAFVLAAPDTARKIYKKIIQTVDSLDAMPERFPIFENNPWKSMEIRTMSVKKYIIFFNVNKQTHLVTIFRIFYSGSDIEKRFLFSEVN